MNILIAMPNASVKKFISLPWITIQPKGNVQIGIKIITIRLLAAKALNLFIRHLKIS